MAKYDVFISYSRKDSAIADKIVHTLENAGISFFIDRQGIAGGMEFPAVLSKAICDSQIFLFLASENSYKSKFSNNEITFAFNKKSKETLLPYIIDNSVLPDEMQFIFAGLNWRTIKEHPIESILIDDIKRLLGRETSAIEYWNLYRFKNAPLGKYSPLSEDISICYESNGYMYCCLAGSGRKIKINIIALSQLSEIEISKRINNINIEDYDNSKGSKTPGLDYIKDNLNILSKKSNLTLIAQNNPQSFANAYKTQKAIQKKFNYNCYIDMASSLYAFGMVFQNAESTMNIDVPFDPYTIRLATGQGVIEIIETIVASETNYSVPIDISYIIKGILLRYYTNSFLLLDTVGLPICIRNKTLRMDIKENLTIPTRRSSDCNQNNPTVELIVGDIVLEKDIQITNNKNKVTIEIDAKRRIDVI